METIVKDVAEACTKGSDAGTATFPSVVKSLMEVGIEWYHADLQRSEKTYYLPSGESVAVPARRVAVELATDFKPAGIDAALRQVQAQKITYGQFCEQIATAGCIGYMVSLVGRRAVYFGRSGETYVEPFPSAK